MTPIPSPGADGPVAPGADAQAAPAVFDAAGARRSSCTLVSVRADDDDLVLWFGDTASRDTAPGSVGPVARHQVRVARETARHLEEALTRLLGPGAAR